MPSCAQPPRLARHLARAPPPAPPSPRGGGCARRPAAQVGSRGGYALRFGARYGSSDSLPRACLPAPPARVPGLAFGIALRSVVLCLQRGRLGGGSFGGLLAVVS